MRGWWIASRSAPAPKRSSPWAAIRDFYRGVIGETAILACADGQVSFRYRNGKTGKTERRTVSGTGSSNKRFRSWLRTIQPWSSGDTFRGGRPPGHA